jgi:methionyl aminopeptidase
VKGRLLVERTYEAMWAGIEAVRPGATLDEVGWAVSGHCSRTSC